MRINIQEERKKYMADSYNEELANAKNIQDIILLKIAKSELKEHVTIKGGVVMFNISNQIRRATLDIDIDLMRYSISDEGIHTFFELLNQVDDGILMKINVPIKELKKEDYKGKRILFSISDSFGNIISNAKIDLGVTKDLSITQDDFLFVIGAYNEQVILYVNSKEQIFAEKLSSLLKHGFRSTRYKDIYDMYYLITETDISIDKVMDILEKFSIYQRFNNLDSIYKQVSRTLNNKIYSRNASRPDNDWIEVDYDSVKKCILEFLNSKILIEV